MRKAIAISLIALFAFNLAGYRILYFTIGEHHDLSVTSDIENGVYNESNLITISVPLSLPYLQDATAFERVDGEIELNGTVYKYVKRKISAGHLVLLCLPDNTKARLNQAANNFTEKESSAKLVIKSVLSDFTEQPLLYEFSIDDHFTVPSRLFSQSRLLSPACTVAEQPPDLM